MRRRLRGARRPGGQPGRRGCSPTRSTSTATRSTSCASATWPAAGTPTGGPERIERSYYGLAWSADSRSLFYIVTDAVYRPYQVWRHDVDTDPDDDVCVFTEDDERFEVIVRAHPQRRVHLHGIPKAARPPRRRHPGHGHPLGPQVVQRARRRGIEYRADHADGPDGGELYLVTNDERDRVPAGPGPVPARATGRGGRLAGR